MIYYIKSKFISEKMKIFFKDLTSVSIENQKPYDIEILSSMKRAKITGPQIICWSEMCFCPIFLKHKRKTV